MRKNGIVGGRSVLEGLENRQLLSTVDVADFGAVADDGRDDRGAIVAAINASKPGDTVKLVGGTFNVSDEITLSPDRTYAGTKRAVLAGRSSEGQIFKLKGDDITIRSLTFKGGGIFIERPGGGFNRNIKITNSIFELDAPGLHPSGITFTSGLQDSEIAHNVFTGPNSPGFGVYGYNYDNLTIKNNEFVNIAAGMHIDAFTNSGELMVKQNFISGARGMGMEFQGTATNLKFLDNWYENPNLSSDFNRNHNSFAYSLILDKSSNIEIKRNVVIAPQRPDGVGTRIGFEVGGDNTVVEQNYVNGVNHVLAANDGVGSASILVKNNKFLNYRQGIGGIRPNSIRYEGSNDGETKLSWELARNRTGVSDAERAEQARM